MTDFLVPRNNCSTPFDLRRGLSRIFSEMTPEFRGGWPFAALRDVSPASNVWETRDAYYIEMAAPGLDVDDVSLSTIGSELTIRLESPTFDKTEREGHYWRQERGQASSTFSMSFPNAVDAQEATADLENGVLLVKIPKGEKAQVKKINVNKNSKRDEKTTVDVYGTDEHNKTAGQKDEIGPHSGDDKENENAGLSSEHFGENFGNDEKLSEHFGESFGEHADDKPSPQFDKDADCCGEEGCEHEKAKSDECCDDEKSELDKKMEGKIGKSCSADDKKAAKFNEKLEPTCDPLDPACDEKFRTAEMDKAAKGGKEEANA